MHQNILENKFKKIIAMPKKKYKIIFTGGGTGGHVFPLVAIIRELKKIMIDEDLDVFYIGPSDKISKEYIAREKVNIRYIHSGKIRRYSSGLLQNIIDILFKIPLGIIQSFFYIFIISPDLIFSKGGYGSLPVVLMAKLFQVPVILHESDAILGGSNQFLQKLSTEVFVSFANTEKTDPKKIFVVGNPIRKELIEGDKEKGRELFKLSSEKPVLLIIGGSQGSERINELFLSAITGFLNDFEVIHQCGENNYKKVYTESQALLSSEEHKNNYHPYPFFDEEQIKNAYAVADLIISRAGSGSIFEIAANGKASVLLPLPESAQNHQVKNAYAYASSRAGIVLEQENLSSNFFLSKIKELFSPIEQIRNMEVNAKDFSRIRAAFIIATYIKEYLIREK